jgi:galactose oxidase-like protein
LARIRSETPASTSALSIAFAVATLAVVGLASPGPAQAHDHFAVKGGIDLPKSKAGERRLRAFETQVLGSEHAREHAIERQAIRRKIRRWKRLSPAQRRRLAERQTRSARTFAAATAGDPAQDGQWTQAPFQIPNYAIHSAVLPTGKVLMWGFPPLRQSNEGRASLWDPTKGTGADAFKEVTPPLIDNPDGSGGQVPAPIYCSSQSFLPSGALLLAGGLLEWPDGSTYTTFAGINRLFSFDPWTETWTEQPRMEKGRYYPSQVELADGRVMIAGGSTDDPPGGVYNTQIEVFTPGPTPSSIGEIHRQPTADRGFSLYPHLFTLPTGNVVIAGPSRGDSDILNTQSFTWEAVAGSAQQRAASPAVLVPGDPSGSSTAMELGGMDPAQRDPSTGFIPATASTESVDASEPASGWSAQSPLNVARANENAVLLPDGSMVAVGGGDGNSPALGSYDTYSDGSARQVELWDPATRTWRLGPAQQEDRAYHSTAVLLPDGRVMSAGDDFHPTTASGGASSTDTAEIYSPPYLFRTPRPTIGLAPSAVHWGDTFGVLSSSSGISRAVLMAPAATTHAVDMHQREVPLQIANNVSGQGVDLVAPPSGGVAPPGYYMLFLLNAQGVPSVASWVRVGADAPDQPSLSGLQGQGPGAPPPPASNGVQGAGPQVGVNLIRNRRALRRGHLIAQVSSNMPASVTLSFSLRSAGSAKKGAGPSLTMSVSLPQAGARPVALAFGRKAVRRGRSLDVTVNAKDSAGNLSAWRGTLKLRG